LVLGGAFHSDDRFAASTSGACGISGKWLEKERFTDGPSGFSATTETGLSMVRAGDDTDSPSASI
jgi:hypothetical protein